MCVYVRSDRKNHVYINILIIPQFNMEKSIFCTHLFLQITFLDKALNSVMNDNPKDLHDLLFNLLIYMV